jgi:hypothetical protein
VALARLEHERWMIERKLAGWTYGPTRDTGKRLHELLVPWEALSPEQVAKDIAQVQAALRVALKRWIRPAREAGPKSISKRYGIAR